MVAMRHHSDKQVCANALLAERVPVDNRVAENPHSFFFFPPRCAACWRHEWKQSRRCAAADGATVRNSRRQRAGVEGRNRGRPKSSAGGGFETHRGAQRHGKPHPRQDQTTSKDSTNPENRSSGVLGGGNDLIPRSISLHRGLEKPPSSKIYPYISSEDVVVRFTDRSCCRTCDSQ